MNEITYQPIINDLEPIERVRLNGKPVGTIFRIVRPYGIRFFYQPLRGNKLDSAGMEYATILEVHNSLEGDKS